MKKTILLFLCWLTALSATASHTLFTIGTPDGKSEEFALSSGGYPSFLAKFGGERMKYYVGYSDPGRDWSYVLPGPLDSWAGGGFWAGYHPRHFPSVYFGLTQTPPQGNCRLTFGFTGTRRESKITLQIEINGNRMEQTITGSDRDDILEQGADARTPQKIDFDFPSAYLHEGMNRIRMGIVSGSWSVFDFIRLETTGKVELAPAGSTLITEVRAAEFEYDRNGTRTQPLLIDITQFDVPSELEIEVQDLPAVRKTTVPGHSIVEVEMPAVLKTRKNIPVVIRSNDTVCYQGTIVRRPGAIHQYADYVDLLIGTGNSRWMFKPASALPLSMVQIAPDNQNETWKAGYEYTIENIAGFNHFSDWTMTGFLTQPTCGPLQVNPGPENDPDKGYRSRIDKRSESARIGHYSVHMTDTDIQAEVTSTRRTALQRYTFPQSRDARILVDLFAPNEYPYNLTHAKVTKTSDTEIEGEVTYYHAFTGYSLQQEYTLYFVLQFSKPFGSMGGWVNENVKPVTGYIVNWNRDHEFQGEADIRQDISSLEGKGDVGIFANFNTRKGERILVRSGVSLVDMHGARNNLKEELSEPFGWDFDAVVKNAEKEWNEILSRIDIETDDYLQKVKFYTNYYRAVAARAIWNDADGRYRDEDEQIRRLPQKTDAIISGEYWNTFWNVQPLFNLIAPEISSKWARSAIELYKNSGYFNTDPAGIEHTGVMVAMHIISQIQGAWQSGIRDFDLNTAYTGLKKMMTAPPETYKGGGTVGVEHIVPYMRYGYIPAGMGYVSNTLEYAYDDWALAQMARTTGHEDDYAYFLKRSENWRNLFDPQTGFIRPKDAKGEWITPFDPYHTPGFVEGNAFNYTWFVPQNPKGLVEAMGKERFIKRLDEAMEKSARANFNAAGDNFAAFPVNHGNETSMEVAWLFNWAGAPWLTQKWVRAIQEQYYGTTPYDAYPGDEDLGQMSGWFTLSALGLFQLDGGCSTEPFYELAAPRYPRITLRLSSKYHGGNTLTIEAENASAENKYIQSVDLNGTEIRDFRILQKDLLKGGILKIVLGDTPFRNADH